MVADARLPTGVRTIVWEEDAAGDVVRLLDQSLLPHQLSYLSLHHEVEVAAAIRSLKVRGAPIIGVTAAFGMALALSRLWREQGTTLTLSQARAQLALAAQLLCEARPTAVNLPWAVQRMLRRADQALATPCSLAELVAALKQEAQLV